MLLGYYDYKFTLPVEWQALVDQAKSYPNVLAFFYATKIPGQSRPVYLVDRTLPTEISMGEASLSGWLLNHLSVIGWQ